MIHQDDQFAHCRLGVSVGARAFGSLAFEQLDAVAERGGVGSGWKAMPKAVSCMASIGSDLASSLEARANCRTRAGLLTLTGIWAACNAANP